MTRQDALIQDARVILTRKGKDSREYQFAVWALAAHIYRQSRTTTVNQSLTLAHHMVGQPQVTNDETQPTG